MPFVTQIKLLSLIYGWYGRYNEAGRVGSGAGGTGIQLLIVTVKLLKDPKQLLLLPITAWLGVGQVFRGSDFTIVSTGT
jgi:hypothetical protein